jgi:hypothetical protein
MSSDVILSQSRALKVDKSDNIPQK